MTATQNAKTYSFATNPKTTVLCTFGEYGCKRGYCVGTCEGMYVKVWDGISKGYESNGILGHTGMGPESECVFSSKCWVMCDAIGSW